MSVFNYVYGGKSYSENEMIQSAFNWASTKKKEGVEGWVDFDFNNIKVGDKNYNYIKNSYLKAFKDKVTVKGTDNEDVLNDNTDKYFNSGANTLNINATNYYEASSSDTKVEFSF